MEPGAGVTVASNRLPVRLSRTDEGTLVIHRSSGGLVSAMKPVLASRGGRWTGWAGIDGLSKARTEKALRPVQDGFALDPVPLSAEEHDRYYLGYANRVLWPILHGLDEFVEHRAGDAEVYRAVNRKFAGALARSQGQGPIWIHDYHLFYVAKELRARGVHRPLGFFLHTGFPSPEELRRLPGHRALLGGLEAYDSIGFQTAIDRDHFLEAMDRLVPDQTSNRAGRTMRRERRPAVRERAGAFPISTDFRGWCRRASAPAVAARAAEIRSAAPGVLLLGVDRLDYSKGLVPKIEGFARALERYPSLVGRATLVQLTVPSREEVPAYARYRRELEELVARVNRRFGTATWTPVEHVHGSWDPDELTARYRAADALLVTSLRDGMNLVAKEYCAARVDEDGVLILSPHAGAARELGEAALLVEPRDADAIAVAIRRAEGMPRAERHRRMRRLRRVIRTADIDRWASDLLESLPRRAKPPVQLARSYPTRAPRRDGAYLNLQP